MTVVKVVDASALAALLFGEPEGELIATLLEGARLIAPNLFFYELANVCLIKCRRYPEQSRALRQAFDMRREFGIEEVAVNHAEARDLAATTGLTAYDASYLWLARQCDAELVTLDRKLAEAASW